MRIFVAVFITLMLAAPGPVAAKHACSDLFEVQGLQPTKDRDLVQNLQDVLDSYRYTENYSASSFNSMDTTVIATRILQENGFNPSTMARSISNGWNDESHAWLAVSDGKGRFAFIETISFASGIPVLGTISSYMDSKDYSSGYVLLDPMNVIRCLGYSDDRFLKDLKKVEQTRPVPKRPLQEGKSEWIQVAIPDQEALKTPGQSTTMPCNQCQWS